MENIVDILGTKQFVVFKLGKEEFGIDIKKVTTIEKLMPIARVPKAIEWLKGVINLRGEIIPVMDLRIKFNFQEMVETDDTRIVIIKIDEITVGIIVDEVDEVIEFERDKIEGVSNFSNNLYLDYIMGVGKIKDKIVTLLNLERLVKTSE